MNITRPRPPHADPYTPRAAAGSVSVPTDAAPPAPAAAPAPARSLRHVTERVPGASAITSRVRVTASTGAPRLAPMRDTVPLRPAEHASSRRNGIAHTSTMGRDGFVTDTRAFGDASGTVAIPTTHTVTCADGFTYTDTAPAPAAAPAVRSADRAAVTVGTADERDACDVTTTTLRDGSTRTVHVDAAGRYVRTVDDDASWSGTHTRTVAPRPARRPSAAAVIRADGPDRTPPARVTNDVVDMFIRATGYAGTIDAARRAAARDYMAAQRQRDAYADAADDDA